MQGPCCACNILDEKLLSKLNGCKKSCVLCFSGHQIRILIVDGWQSKVDDV
jgi:hypothetical protein